MNIFSEFLPEPTVLEQTMKKKMLLTAVLLMVWVFPCAGIALQKAVIIDPVFTFQPVPEGVHVDHVFIVKNTGDTVLRIEKVMPP
ncbi:MAG: hypothetical protein A3J85_06435 [Desulfobacula sp. RIFOXYA12_FULL_46_16]|nr:MAG: hypothetical protein A2464_10755 [Deltaproteobacteria bacterium RIFOXYC2_FULL_48_10]OGR21334.1 MAG: hypothetical protein A3J85_06435 [Desulfobacula sp. RIFOXYA12_FULL_46_16]